MSGSKNIVYGLYQNKQFDEIQLCFVQYFSNMSKIHHVKKLFEDLNVFRKYFRVRQDVSDEIQRNIYFIKNEIQTSIETNISCKKAKKKYFGWMGMD